MDPRREAAAIWKHMDRYQQQVGTTILYYRVDLVHSVYDDVYDEGGTHWYPGVRVPILWVDQSEATEDYNPEGRRPTQRIRLAVSARAMHESGISVTEAHGNRDGDWRPNEKWLDDRLHDVFYFDGRYYEVSGFQIRGYLKDVDVVIGIAGIETYDVDDRVFDLKPGETAQSIIP